MSADRTAAAPGAERAFTRELARLFATEDPGVLLGIGDDAAVLRTGPRTVAACDPVVEGVHFTRGDSLALVGRKAVHRNLSDLAAMGALPRYLLVSLLLPGWFTAAARRQLVHGIAKAARGAHCAVVGGDVARTPGPLVVTVTALGAAPRRPLRRSGLRPGDHLHVTGPLGGSSAGRHLRFLPRVAEGAWLAGQRVVTAAIDVSDGLLLDLATLLEASDAPGAVLDARAIPVHPAAHRMALSSGHTALHHALGDGEDHELLFGCRGSLPDGGPLRPRARRPIGTVSATPGLMLRQNGRLRPVTVAGYQHDV